MRETNLAGVDLNLLPALEALIRRRNVTLAGRDVGLSQPASRGRWRGCGRCSAILFWSRRRAASRRRRGRMRCRRN